MNAAAYRIVVDGVLDDVTAAGFDDVRIERGDDCTTLFTPVVDQPGLAGILDRLRRVGAALASLDRTSPATRG